MRIHRTQKSCFARFTQQRHSGKEFSIGMCHKTILGVDDGFGDRTAPSDSRIYVTIPGQSVFGPVLQVHVIQYLGINSFLENWCELEAVKSLLLLDSCLPRLRSRRFGGSRAGHAKCILRATSDGWQACLHGIRSRRRAVTD